MAWVVEGPDAQHSTRSVLSASSFRVSSSNGPASDILALISQALEPIAGQDGLRFALSDPWGRVRGAR